MPDLLLAALCAALVAIVFIAEHALKRRRAAATPAAPASPLMTFASWATKALVIGLLAEVTIFNLPRLALQGLEKNIEIAADQVTPKNARLTEAGFVPTSKHAKLTLPAPHARLANVHVALACSSPKRTEKLSVIYADADSSRRSVRAQVATAAPDSHYIQLRPSGEVTALAIKFPRPPKDTKDAKAPTPCAIGAITLNKDLPLTIHWWQLAVWSLAIGAGAYALRYRRDLARYLRTPGGHRAATIAIGGALVAGLLFTVGTSAYGQTRAQTSPQITQYSQGLVKALRAGHLHLDYPVSDSLKSLPDPYDIAQRKAKNVKAVWDVAYFDGHYYCYFGIVPVLTLFLPFNLITGGYLDNHFAVAFFGIGAIMALMAVWRTLCRRLLPPMPVSLYFLGLTALPVCSWLFYDARRPLFYEVAVTAGLAFAAAGIAALLQVRPGNPRSWASAMTGCLSLAVAVGCRPNLFLVSLLVIPLAWTWVFQVGDAIRTRLARIGMIALPYALVAIPLAAYNYARFGSPLEFGQNYQITTQNNAAYLDISLAGMAEKAFGAVTAYVAQPYRLSTWFPFVTQSPVADGYQGYIYHPAAVGLICVPITLFVAVLPFLRRRIRARAPQLTWLLAAMIVAGIAIMVFTAISVGVHPRYSTDFAWLFVLAGLVGAVFTWERIVADGGARVGRIALIGINAVLVVGLIGMVLLSLTGEHNRLWAAFPELYLQLQHLVAPWQWGAWGQWPVAVTPS